MKSIVTVLAVLSMVTAALAAENAPAPPTGSAKFSQFIGTWSGEGQLQDAGKPAIKVRMKVDCRPAGGGWGVKCDFNMTAPDMNYLESDLFGFDANEGKVHWYSVTNAGEVHDHAGTWVDNSRLSVRYVGGKEVESIVLWFDNSNAMSFRADTDVAGTRTNTLTGSVQRR
jgi:hypothetical protein